MLDKVKEMLADQLGIDADTIGAEQSLKEDLNADSLDLFEMVTNLEDTYEIEIPTEDLEKMLTVQDVADYLTAKGIEA
ncbi:MAG: acyl carrier protein [Lachnospiraceae bacterium]|nr:acyl carrier protein [Lachnospiraceae bacterium]MCD8125114.1 acyl carrier protein [Lachnospiraceae bacterium]